MTTELIVQGCFGVAALVNLGPAVGLLGSTRLQRLYGVPVEDPDLLVLMRHRALLFAIVGMLLAAAVFRSELRDTAAVCGLTSMVGFVVIAALSPGLNAKLKRVTTVDVVATAVLVAGWML